MKFGVRASATTSLVAIILVMGCIAALLAASGLGVSAAFVALGRGAFGSWYAFGSGTLVRASPLILTGLAVAVAFRGGVFNIGAEGQFLIGAAAATAIALAGRSLSGFVLLPAVLCGGAVAGASWAGIAALLRQRFRVLEVISTIMLNFVAAYVVSYLVRGPLQEPTRVNPQTETIVAAARLPRLGAGTRLHVGFVIAVAACVIAWWMLRSTAAGFRLRVTGANPHAARSAGMIAVERVSTNAFLLSGALAGLAGAIEVAGVTYVLYEDISPGYGYTAIAVALLARLDAAGIIGTGIVFGALEAGATAMQRDAGVPSVVVSVAEPRINLALVAIDRVRGIQGSAVA